MLELRSGEDIVRARLAARDLVRQAGLGVMDQTRFATAVSELGRNAVRYAVQASCEFADLSDARHWRLQAMISDRGPGIQDLTLAMQDGYSTGGSLGAGLPGARRLVDVFEIRSDGSGTVVTVQLVRPRRT